MKKGSIPLPSDQIAIEKTIKNKKNKKNKKKQKKTIKNNKKQ